MSKALGVSMSGFYAWKKSPISEREAKKIALQNSIRQEYERQWPICQNEPHSCGSGDERARLKVSNS
jgi:hypothetical protein